MRGDKGPEVTKIQAKLMSLGYELPVYGADGDYGDETMTAVENFQRDNKIAMSGVVNTETYNALFSSSAVVRSAVPENSYTMVAPPQGLFAKYFTKKVVMYGAIGIGAFILMKQLQKRKRA
jgi:peptidoglycan hydrolase-like protein with peptidoglycan-binding domain